MIGKLKILNLYAGIGGNRKLWDEVMDVEVTAMEIKEDIANIYQDFFPQDKVIVTDAHEYLKEHYKEFDFIWSSPPCQTHSKIRWVGTQTKHPTTDAPPIEPVYPNMNLYEEILFLKYYFKGKWVVENVKPFYNPLIKPQEVGRHLIWANFIVSNFDTNEAEVWNTNKGLSELKGFDISNYNLDMRKDQILRNCVHPKLGKHILKSAYKDKQQTLDIIRR